MAKTCITVGIILFGWLGWWISDYFHGSFVTSYFISGIGSLVGVFAGWYVSRHFFR